MSAQAPATVSDCLPLLKPTPDMGPLPSDSGMGSGAPQRVLEATFSLHAHRHSAFARRIGFAPMDAGAGPELLAALGVGRVGIGAAGEAPSRQLCLVATEALANKKFPACSRGSNSSARPARRCPWRSASSPDSLCRADVAPKS